jgi:hypothetical protein
MLQATELPRSHAQVARVDRGMATIRKRLFISAAAALLALSGGFAFSHGPHDPDEKPRHPFKGKKPVRQGDSKNMRLVGFNDLQARSAYQPIIHRVGERWIAFIGHHGGTALNPLTKVEEPNGTSIVDVTNPRKPVYLKHIPGGAGAGEAGGAQMVRMCAGSDLPKGVPGKYYLLRATPSSHEIYDVTDPAKPTLLKVVVDGLNDTHKSWWECDTGIAYLVSGVPGWRTNRHTQVFDLSDPLNPVFIRNFGLPGQQPGATSEPVETALHGPIRLGDRIFFGYGTNRNGVLQIVDREKLLTGPAEPTEENLLFPQVARYDIGALQGAHTTFPIYNVRVPEFLRFTEGELRNLVAVTNESIGNECREPPQLMYIVDVTTETEPFGVSNFQVKDEKGDFCARGGRFGTHSSNENMTQIYYGKVIFLAYFNAGVRAVDIRDPWRPRQIAYFIPETTQNTEERCVVTNGVQTCKIAIQTNNVEVDDRGYIYAVDRANTGMHILQLTGEARKGLDLP